jgi:hypothetical protein
MWLYVLTEMFERITMSLQQAIVLPEDRDELSEGLSDLVKLHRRVEEVIQLGQDKDLENLFLGKRINQLLRAASVSLLKATEAWGLELNNRFPELFADLDRTIDSVKLGTLPDMPLATLELAKQALRTSKEAETGNIDEWARCLTEDILRQND